MKFQEKEEEKKIEIDDLDLYNEEEWDTKTIIKLRFKKPPTEHLITEIINNLVFNNFFPINIIMSCSHCDAKTHILEHLTY